MEYTYIDPLYDIGFKLLLGRENVSEEVLMNFLNAIFDGDPELSSIIHLRYLNTEHQGEWKDAKGIRYDIMCETSSGHRFIVEMQKASQENFVKRGIYYVCRSIAEQGHRGKDEDELSWEYDVTPVIGVFLCNFHVPALPYKTLTKARILDEETSEPVGDLMRLVFIQLPSFDKREEECVSEFDQWIYNLKNMGQNQAVAFQNRNEIFRRVANIGRLANLSPDERRDYETEIKYARDTYNQIKFALKEGMEKGLEKGRAEGRAEGELLGLEKTARKMKRMGFSHEDIHSITGLELNRIETL